MAAFLGLWISDRTKTGRRRRAVGRREFLIFRGKRKKPPKTKITSINYDRRALSEPFYELAARRAGVCISYTRTHARGGGDLLTQRRDVGKG